MDITNSLISSTLSVSTDHGAMARVKFQGEQLAEYIGEQYIDKVIDYIKGVRASIVTSKEYMQIYNYVIEQCDYGDNSAKLYDYFLVVIRRFIDTVCSL